MAVPAIYGIVKGSTNRATLSCSRYFFISQDDATVDTEVSKGLMSAAPALGLASPMQVIRESVKVVMEELAKFSLEDVTSTRRRMADNDSAEDGSDTSSFGSNDPAGYIARDACLRFFQDMGRAKTGGGDKSGDSVVPTK